MLIKYNILNIKFKNFYEKIKNGKENIKSIKRYKDL